MSETIISNGRSYEIEDTIIDVDGEQFATVAGSSRQLCRLRGCMVACENPR
jgi:hypothetical protein